MRGIVVSFNRSLKDVNYLLIFLLKRKMCSFNDWAGELFQEKNNKEFKSLCVCMLRIKRGEELFL